MKKHVSKSIAALLLAVLTALALCSCKKNKEETSPAADDVTEEQTIAEQHVNSSASGSEEEDGVKLRIRTSSDYYIDGEQIVMIAVITNDTNGYIPVCSPAAARGREGALVMDVTADGYELKCLQDEWGKTMPVSMTDADAPYCYLLEPSESVSCTYVFDSKAIVNGGELPLWQTTINAKLTVQTGEQLPKRQGGLSKLDYTPHDVSVEITFDGTSDRP